jgi:hypothetical protein
LIGIYMIERGVDRIAWKLTSWPAQIEHLHRKLVWRPVPLHKVEQIVRAQ